MCMTMYPACVLMNDYFGDRFLFWNSVSNLGILAGAFTLPLVVERSLEAYGYHGAFLIMGGLALNSVVCGAGMRSKESVEGRPIQTLPKPDPARGDDGFQRIRLNEMSPMVDKVDLADCSECRISNAQETPVTVKEYYVSESCHTNDTDPTVSLTFESDKKLDRDQTTGLKNNDCSVKGDSKDHIMSSFRDSQCQRDESSSLFQKGKDEEENADLGNRSDKETSEEAKLLQRIISFVTSNVLFTEPTFAFLVLGAVLYMSVYYAWLLFLVPHAMWLGIPVSKAVLLSTMGGVTGIIGHLIFLVVDHWKKNIFIFFAACCTASALVFFLDSMSSSFWFLSLTAMLQGICIFGADSFPTAVAKRVIKNSENFPSALSVINVSASIGAVIGDILSGIPHIPTLYMHGIQM